MDCLAAIRTLVACLVVAVSTHGESFRIETKIYVGEQEEPTSETMTLFEGGVVYDFLAAPKQIAVFRKPSADRPGRFILLDPQREFRTELDTERIDRALTKIRDWASEQPDPMLRFAAAPEFEESYTAESGELVLASHLQTYRVATSVADKPAALAEYREFLDWYSRLNALHRGLPPEPRLALNAALTRHAVVPVSVELTRAGDREPIRAEHDFTWRLSQDDRGRIDEVREAMANYRQVSNEIFVRRHGSQQ